MKTSSSLVKPVQNIRNDMPEVGIKSFLIGLDFKPNTTGVLLGSCRRQTLGTMKDAFRGDSPFQYS